MMNRTFVLAALLCFLTAGYAAAGDSSDTVDFGIHAAAGLRYDDVRMCVGSDAGTKGGPIMDIYFDIRFAVGERGTLAVNIPVMRPILFGAAFEMLQFEPQLSYEYRFGNGGSPRFVLGGGLGAIFHWGPDYESSESSRGEDFFAAGPLVSLFAGVEFEGKKRNWMPGIKAFYAPLFSADYDTGNVAGGVLELHCIF